MKYHNSRIFLRFRYLEIDIFNFQTSKTQPASQIREELNLQAKKLRDYE